NGGKGGNPGSGGGDLGVFIPVSLFAGYGADKNIYLDNPFGNPDAFNPGIKERGQFNPTKAPPPNETGLNLGKDTLGSEGNGNVETGHSANGGNILQFAPIEWTYTLTDTQAGTSAKNIVLVDDQNGIPVTLYDPSKASTNGYDSHGLL